MGAIQQSKAIKMQKSPAKVLKKALTKDMKRWEVSTQNTTGPDYKLPWQHNQDDVMHATNNYMQQIKALSPQIIVLPDYRLIINKKTKFELSSEDIVFENVDALINPANGHLNHDGGLAGMIARNGGDVINNESKEWIKSHGKLPVSASAVTKAGGKLNAGYIIHTVGPTYKDDNTQESKDEAWNQLRACVINSLDAAKQLGLESVAIPAISVGMNGFPIDECGEVMI